jgi:peroxiredoxin
MKRVLFFTLFMIGLVSVGYGQLKPGDAAPAFNLKNVDGSMVALSDYSESKGVILIFTCNPCPFSKAYEDRIIQLHKGFSPEGYPVVAINPNDETVSPDDTFEKMKERAASKNFPFVYLKDDEGVFKQYGATRTPHVFLLDNDGKGNFTVAFIGAIDNNAMEAKNADVNYVRNAILALEQGKKPSPDQVKAIGCTIKMKK